MRILFVISLSLFTLLLADFAVSKLQQSFESSSLLTIKPPVINGVAQPFSDEDLNQRISTMNNEVLSRSSLEPMIAKYELYKDEKSKGMPIEMIVEKMKRATTVEIDESNIGFHQFRVSFRYRNAEKAQQVTAELASKYVSTQIDQGISIVELTRDFLDRQIKDAKSKLKNLKGKELEAAKVEYKFLLDKQNDSHLCLDCGTNPLSETIKVQDAANLPKVSPNRVKLDAIGAGFGFILGLMLVCFAGIIEARRPQLR